MTKPYPFQPDYAVPPGATLKETLEVKGLSQADLALRTGLAEKTVSQIVNGIAPISYETASKFEMALGIPASFWNSREQTYRETLIRIEEIKRLEKDTDWLKEIPLATLIDRNYVRKDEDQRSVVRQALQFFGVSSVEAWRNTWIKPAALYRGQAVQEKRPGHVATWLRMGEIQAEAIVTEPFDPVRFKAVLAEGRTLTTARAKEWGAKLIELCASAGVALVFTKEIPGASVSGATRWLTKDKALIQLSLKYKSNDQIWFTFFHEAGHILLHGKKDVFVDYGISDANDEEREANVFARDWLIPPEMAHRLPYLKNRAQITTFAEAIGIAPGIVVGRLQHDDFVPPSALNDLKRKIDWEA